MEKKLTDTNPQDCAAPRKLPFSVGSENLRKRGEWHKPSGCGQHLLNNPLIGRSLNKSPCKVGLLDCTARRGSGPKVPSTQTLRNTAGRGEMFIIEQIYETKA